MRNQSRGIDLGRAATDLGLRVADETLVGIEHRSHAGGVDQSERRKGIVRVRIARQLVLRLLCTGVTGAFQLGNAQQALDEQRGLILIEAGNRLWNCGGRIGPRPGVSRPGAKPFRLGLLEIRRQGAGSQGQCQNARRGHAAKASVRVRSGHIMFPSPVDPFWCPVLRHTEFPR